MQQSCCPLVLQLLILIHITHTVTIRQEGSKSVPMHGVPGMGKDVAANARRPELELETSLHTILYKQTRFAVTSVR